MSNAIEIQGLTKAYGRVAALRGVDLQVPQGSVTALLGMNGAGKTTLLRCLMGMITPDAGRGTILGYPVNGSGFPPVALKARIGYVGERPALHERMTAAELLAFVRKVHIRWDQALVERYLALFSLPLERQIRTYSTGMRSQLALTLAMGGNPDLLILDEPTLGLDPYHRNQYLQVLLGDAVDAGRTVFLSTHDLHQIERLADQVVILHGGRVLVAAPLDHLKEQVKRVRVGFLAQADEDSLAVRMADMPGVQVVRREGAGRYLLTVYGDMGEVAETLRTVPEMAGLRIYDLSLEEIFLAFVAPR
jgi:ABC-2 type transport system ATP-binding protein